MTAFQQHTFKQTITKCGDFFSWWLPGSPKDGELHLPSEVAKGEMPIASVHRRSPDGKYREGGAWLMEKNHARWWGQSAQVYRLGAGLAYSGIFHVANTTPFGLLPTKSVEDTWQEAYDYGAQAWSAMKADKPNFSAVTSLLELRELPKLYKQLISDRLRDLRREQARRGARNRYWYSYAGEHYLMVQFGLVPLIRDCTKFLELFNQRKKRFDQLLRDEARPVRRHRILDSKDESDDEIGTTFDRPNMYGSPDIWPYLVSSCYGKGVHTTTSLKKTRKVWVKGASRYWLPPGPRDAAWTRKIQRRIFGGRLTASQIYNAIPWSWFIDYFTDLGYFMEAASEGVADKTVIDYAYIMVEDYSETHAICTQSICASSAGASQTVQAFRDNEHSRKARVHASPFGWGLTDGDLSVYQIAILGALGASKL